MVVSMREGCPKAEVAAVIAAMEGRGLKVRIISPGPKVVLGVVEQVSKHLTDDLRFEISDMPGVEEVSDFHTDWKLVWRGPKQPTSVVRMGGRTIGGDELMVIAGPCAVESRENLLQTARSVCASGAGAIRGGAFKPRTSPYSFRGLGEEGLKYLAEAREATGLPVVTEVMSFHEVDLVARYADVLQIGARNMQNFTLLEAVGEVDKPVLLKRGLGNTVKELLLCAEYILARGNQQVMFCERGIRTFETDTRNTLDIQAVPILKQASHLPVVVDPSHAAGKRELVPAMAMAAVAAGADGLMIEVHPDPPNAFSDGRQTLDLSSFDQLMKKLARVAAAVDKTIPGVEI